ncbi:uncharacterized protein LOC116950916 isoform X2 [Petromyzon marinus]|uniref:Myosin-10-like isoform X2 n=1 Tax=Petromyzon marinus TaxID=7757 RepID=A0AAJ7X8I8_PETMA|nr:myosin-10-like isoform X2 [Petromyzon marinus]
MSSPVIDRDWDPDSPLETLLDQQARSQSTITVQVEIGELFSGGLNDDSPQSPPGHRRSQHPAFSSTLLPSAHCKLTGKTAEAEKLPGESTAQSLSVSENVSRLVDRMSLCLLTDDLSGVAEGSAKTSSRPSSRGAATSSEECDCASTSGDSAAAVEVAGDRSPLETAGAEGGAATDDLWAALERIGLLGAFLRHELEKSQLRELLLVQEVHKLRGFGSVGGSVGGSDEAADDAEDEGHPVRPRRSLGDKKLLRISELEETVDRLKKSVMSLEGANVKMQLQRSDGLQQHSTSENHADELRLGRAFEGRGLRPLSMSKRGDVTQERADDSGIVAGDTLVTSLVEQVKELRREREELLYMVKKRVDEVERTKEDEVSLMRCELSRNKSEVERLEDSRNYLAQKLTSLDTENKALGHVVVEKDQILQAMQGEHAELLRKTLRLEQDLRSVRVHLAETEKLNRAYLKELKALLHRFEDLRAHAKALESERRQNMQDRQTFLDLLEGLRSETRRLEMSFSVKKAEKELAQQEVDLLKKDVKILTEERARSFEDKRKLESSAMRLREELKGVRIRLQRGEVGRSTPPSEMALAEENVRLESEKQFMEELVSKQRRELEGLQADLERSKAIRQISDDSYGSDWKEEMHDLVRDKSRLETIVAQQRAELEALKPSSRRSKPNGSGDVEAEWRSERAALVERNRALEAALRAHEARRGAAPEDPDESEDGSSRSRADRLSSAGSGAQRLRDSERAHAALEAGVRRWAEERGLLTECLHTVEKERDLLQLEMKTLHRDYLSLSERVGQRLAELSRRPDPPSLPLSVAELLSDVEYAARVGSHGLGGGGARATASEDDSERSHLEEQCARLRRLADATHRCYSSSSELGASDDGHASIRSAPVARLRSGSPSRPLSAPSSWQASRPAVGSLSARRSRSPSANKSSVPGLGSASDPLSEQLPYPVSGSLAAPSACLRHDRLSDSPPPPSGGRPAPHASGSRKRWRKREESGSRPPRDDDWLSLVTSVECAPSGLSDDEQQGDARGNAATYRQPGSLAPQEVLNSCGEPLAEVKDVDPHNSGQPNSIMVEGEDMPGRRSFLRYVQQQGSPPTHLTPEEEGYADHIVHKYLSTSGGPAAPAPRVSC